MSPNNPIGPETNCTPPHPVTRLRVLCEMPGTEAVQVRRDLVFRGADGSELFMDCYLPPDSGSGILPPAVVIVAGYPDPGYQRVLGCRFKNTAMSVSWGRLIAASGMAAVAYSNTQPVADLEVLLEYVQRDAASLGVDASRIGLWASSGNVPLALSTLIDHGRALRCAAFCYGYMLDLDGATDVAAAAAKFGFVNPGAGKSMADLPGDRPLFVARAGRDEMPGLNNALDRFVAGALAANLPLTVVNHAKGPHAFDLYDEGEWSRDIVRQILAFLKLHLLTSSTL